MHEGGAQFGGGLGVRPNGRVWIAGSSQSTDIATPGAFAVGIAGGADALLVRLDPGEPTGAEVTQRGPCSGQSVPGGIVLTSGEPLVGSVATVAIDDPSGAAGLVPSASVTSWWISLAAPSAFPCGTTYSPTLLGPSEVLISIAPPNPLFTTAFQLWPGPGQPNLHAVPIPDLDALKGVTLYTQGLLVGPAGGVALTDAIDLKLGS